MIAHPKEEEEIRGVTAASLVDEDLDFYEAFLRKIKFLEMTPY